MKFVNLFKLKNTLTFVAIICVQIIVLHSNSVAQNVEIKIKLNPISSHKLMVEGSFLNIDDSFKDWKFLKNYADVSNLGERIENVRFYGEDYNIPIKKLASGEFQVNENPRLWKYEVNVAKASNITDIAHISWVSENYGILMMADLLPEFKKNQSVKITFDLPNDWKIFTTETNIAKNSFKVDDLNNAIFIIGKNWREKNIQIDKNNISILSTGVWQFSDDESSEMANSILLEHKKVFGDIPFSKVQIILSPFQQENTDFNRWRAETRGSNVLIISGQIPYKSVAIQRLHEQLRHEIFHLWIPNSLNLSGNYDWFYEGFTLYQALRTGVELNQIRFEDYLSTLARAYNLADSDVNGKTLSLIEASNKRWENSSNFIYAKGLIIAFLCDVILLRESKGRRNLKEIFRQIYQQHRKPNKIQDGNTAILNILNTYPELKITVNNYIVGTPKIDWQKDLESAGIDFDGQKLNVKTKLDGRQKDLLDKLGYNQWRKLLEKKK